MTNGDKAAAAGLTVFNVNQLVSKVWDYLNIRGDEVAAVITRVTKLESNAKTRETIYTANALGGSGRTMKAVTTALVIPKAAYARSVSLAWRATVTDHTGATDVHIRRSDRSDSLSTVRANSTNETASGALFDTIPANTTYTYTLACDVASGSDNGDWTISGTDAYTGLQAKVTAIS